jgi:uncharacterized protein (TIGR02246 family)
MAILSWSLPLIVRFVRLVSMALVLLSPAAALAGAGEEANALIDRWSAAYSSNDPDAVVKMYRPDAVVLGTVSPVMSEGTDAIRAYFAAIQGSGNKNAIGERRTLVLSDNAVLVTGFYEFTRVKEGKPVPDPGRFTMLLIKHDGEWLISHHHSSPRAK